jgi:probable rRNA maturation factor
VKTTWLRKIAQTIFAALDLADRELSIVITGDAEIAALNRVWRGKDRATDVLSFSQAEGEGEAGHVLGDVVISWETALRQGERLDHEVCRLLIHGVLHLQGYDHVHGGRQAARMRREEERLWRLVRQRL